MASALDFVRRDIQPHVHLSISRRVDYRNCTLHAYQDGIRGSRVQLSHRGQALGAG
jgi:hypothetical protein